VGDVFMGHKGMRKKLYLYRSCAISGHSAKDLGC
jgi:hypothetical protein